MCVATAVDAEARELRSVAAAAGNPQLPPRINAKFTWGWVTGTVYFNRAETRRLKTASFTASMAGTICASFGLQTFGTVCGVTAAAQGQWNYVATNTYAQGKCVKIKIPTLVASSYSGGYCR